MNSQRRAFERFDRKWPPFLLNFAHFPLAVEWNCSLHAKIHLRNCKSHQVPPPNRIKFECGRSLKCERLRFLTHVETWRNILERRAQAEMQSKAFQSNLESTKISSENEVFIFKKISKFWSHLHVKSNVVISKNYKNKPLDYANEGANECSVAKWRGHYGGIFGTLCWRPCLKRTRERLFARRSRPWLVLTQWNLGVVNESRREFDWQIHGNAVGVAVIYFVI